MKITIHIGPKCTGAESVLTHLKGNADLLKEHGIYLRLEKAHLTHLSEAMRDNRSAEEFFDMIDVPDTAKTLVLWNETQIGTPDRPFGKRFWYGRARARMAPLHEFFTGVDLSTAFAMRNPASFIPAMYAELLQNRMLMSFEDFVGQTPLDQLLWSELIERLQLHDGYKPIITWRYEDYDYLWRDVVQAICGLENAQILDGMVAPLPPTPPLKALAHYYEKAQEIKASGEALTPEHWTSFLEELDALTMLPEAPNWSEQRTMDLSDIYDEDLYSVARMEAVHFIDRRALP